MSLKREKKNIDFLQHKLTYMRIGRCSLQAKFIDNDLAVTQFPFPS
jgi:hypothetical protein